MRMVGVPSDLRKASGVHLHMPLGWGRGGAEVLLGVEEGEMDLWEAREDREDQATDNRQQ